MHLDGCLARDRFLPFDRNIMTLSAYHLNGIFGDSGKNSNGTVHLGGMFSEKKVIPFEVFAFSPYEL